MTLLFRLILRWTRLIIDIILIFIYTVKITSPTISGQKNAAGLNRAEILTVLSALALLHYIFYKNSGGLILVRVKLFYWYVSAIKYKICRSRIIYNKSYKNIKFNIVTCMKVTGEIFSFQKKWKEAEEARYQKYPNFQAKGLLPDRTLESFILKSTDGATPNL